MEIYYLQNLSYFGWIVLYCWCILSLFSPKIVPVEVVGVRAADELDSGFVVTEESHTWDHFHYSGSSSNGSQNLSPNISQERSHVKSNNSQLRIFNLNEKAKFWGCYHYWSALEFIENSNNNNFFKELYRKDVNPDRCKQACQNSDYAGAELFMIRGTECTCTKWIYFAKTRVRDEYCNITCPGIGEDAISQESSCGGNLVVSVYCIYENDVNCKENVAKKEQIEGYSLEYMQDKRNELEERISDSKQCLMCTMDGGDCFRTGGFSQPHDYFPQNNPLACILNCRQRMEINGREKDFVVAYLTWRYSSPGLQLPVCFCREKYPVNESFELVNEENCNQPCPLSQDADDICGSSENIQYVSAFIINDYGIEIPEPEPEETQSGSTNGTTEATTEKADTTTTTTTTTMTTTTRRPVPITTRVALTTPTTTRPSSSCPQKCVSTYQGVTWEGCPEEIVRKPCQNGSDGLAYESWKCLRNCSFENSAPDSSNCSTPWYHDMFDEFNKTLEQNDQTLPKESAQQLLKTMETKVKPTENNTRPYYGHEIKNIAGLIYQIVNASVKHVNLSELHDLLQNSVTLSSLLLKNKQPWEELANISHRLEAGNTFLKNIEESVFTLSNLVKQNKYIASFESGNLPKDQFLVSYGTGSRTEETVLTFPIDPSQQSSFIQLGQGWEDLVEIPDYVGYLIDPRHYKDIFLADLTNFLKNTGGDPSFSKVLNSKLMSLTIKGLASSGSQSGNLGGKKVRITFQHDVQAWGSEAQNIPRKLHANETRKAALGSAVCVYWSVGENKWSSNGCQLISSTRTHTICECNHLTSFAVLMDSHNYVGKDFALEILTLILCPISVVCLLISVIIFTVVNAIQCHRTTITKHLCSCLMIGMILLLLLVDRNYFFLPMGVCVAVGIMTHYIYLAAFTWMAIEGIHLYQMVVHVFDSGRSRTTMYRIIAYGIPVLIVGTTCVVGFLLDHHPYGGEIFCWLEGPYIWSFIIPVVVVVMGNMIILFVALKTAYEMKTTTATSQARQRRYKTWIRGCFSITVLLGITWMPGFVILSNSITVSKIAAYVFVIFNASQGIFLFIFHCLMNEKVRFAAERNLSLPSWLSMTSNSNSKEPSQNGYRSENMRAYCSEASKSIRHNGNENAWSKSPTSSGTSDPRIGSSGLRLEPNILDKHYSNYPDIVQERAYQVRTSDSGLSDSSQKSLVSTTRRR
ncbi:unnamed protein product [Allacma fusca]|uniref:Uncharacterized protein n=1 Tax=Allacma fusca TaxID=39272 RepID=A0A8J2KK17_9HEXA|nr:unnamed protein product [Allacma fusca]